MNKMHKDNPGYHYHRNNWRIGDGTKKKEVKPIEEDYIKKRALDEYDSRQHVDDYDPLYDEDFMKGL